MVMKRIMGSIILSCSVFVFLVSSVGAQTLKVGMTSKTLFYLCGHVHKFTLLYASSHLAVGPRQGIAMIRELSKKAHAKLISDVLQERLR